MLRKKGGDAVKFGFYWNMKEWDAQIVPKEGGVLEGPAERTYVRLPLLAVIVVAPLMGAVYAFFLPFIGFAMVAMYLAGRLRAMFRRTPPAVEAVVRPKAFNDRRAGKEEAVFKKAA
ncbi:MAG TPA: hypothetical protein VLD67_11585 [Vicinamibacterales bacterium]|nr:hypothetical protein [Vicinamibacterales bacterium]